jgi:hypothetical protein
MSKIVINLLIIISFIVFLSSCETHNSDTHSGLMSGTPVPHKIGYVTSPHAPYAGYVDIRRYSAGNIINCPYTGEPFIVPSYGNKSQASEELNQIRAEKARLMELIAKSEESNEPPQRVQNVRESSSIYDEIDRIRSIRNPNERVNANMQFLKGIRGDIGQKVESNPQAFGGMSADEFFKESAYRQAREEGLAPSEAQIEAERSYRNMKRFMNQ